MTAHLTKSKKMMLSNFKTILLYSKSSSWSWSGAGQCAALLNSCSNQNNHLTQHGKAALPLCQTDPADSWPLHVGRCHNAGVRELMPATVEMAVLWTWVQKLPPSEVNHLLLPKCKWGMKRLCKETMISLLLLLCNKWYLDRFAGIHCTDFQSILCEALIKSLVNVPHWPP